MATKPTMWCPGCAEHHPCNAVRPLKDGLLMKMFGLEEKRGGLTNPNGHYPANGLGAPAVRWFERHRRCKNCGSTFETREVEAHVVDAYRDLSQRELVHEQEIERLKHALTSIRETVDAHLPKPGITKTTSRKKNRK